MQDEYIHYGAAIHASEFQRLDPKTRLVAEVASILAFLLCKQKLSTTSIFRKKTTDSGIHQCYRAIDFAPLATIQETYWLIDRINQLFIYDPARPTFKVAAENPYHGTNVHIHLQTHANTTSITTEQTLQILARASRDKAMFKPLDLA